MHAAFRARIRIDSVWHNPLELYACHWFFFSSCWLVERRGSTCTLVSDATQSESAPRPAVACDGATHIQVCRSAAPLCIVLGELNLPYSQLQYPVLGLITFGFQIQLPCFPAIDFAGGRRIGITPYDEWLH
jgi:hypothetical protein